MPYGGRGENIRPRHRRVSVTSDEAMTCRRNVVRRIARMTANPQPCTAMCMHSLPYPSMPITNTQPAHLVTPATPFGIAAPAINRPPMLERGCTSGGNVIRLPVRFPFAGVTGADISRRHIGGSHKRISEGSLTPANHGSTTYVC
jgi:hypothetical protein